MCVFLVFSATIKNLHRPITTNYMFQVMRYKGDYTAFIFCQFEYIDLLIINRYSKMK